MSDFVHIFCPALSGGGYETLARLGVTMLGGLALAPLPAKIAREQRAVFGRSMQLLEEDEAAELLTERSENVRAEIITRFAMLSGDAKSAKKLAADAAKVAAAEASDDAAGMIAAHRQAVVAMIERHDKPLPRAVDRLLALDDDLAGRPLAGHPYVTDALAQLRVVVESIAPAMAELRRHLAAIEAAAERAERARVASISALQERLAVAEARANDQAEIVALREQAAALTAQLARLTGSSTADAA